VDYTVTPMSGAVVQLRQNGATATNGLFGFDDVPEGVYFLDIEHLRHASVSTSVDVTAEATNEPLKIQMMLLPGSDYNAIPLNFKGLVQCGLRWTVASITGCGVYGGTVGDKTNEATFFVDEGNMDWIQTESTWTANDARSERMC
jgi:hypothetical protein